MNGEQNMEETSDRIEKLLASCLEGPESGWSDAIEDLCAEQQDVADDIRRRFGYLQQLGFHLPGLENTPSTNPNSAHSCPPPSSEEASE